MKNTGLFLIAVLLLPALVNAFAEKQIEFSIIYNTFDSVDLLDANLMQCKNQDCSEFLVEKDFECNIHFCLAKVDSFASMYKLSMDFSDKKRTSKVFEHNQGVYSDFLFSFQPEKISFDVKVEESNLSVKNTTFFSNLWKMIQSLIVILVLSFLLVLLVIIFFKFLLKKTVSRKPVFYVYLMLVFLLIIFWIIF